MVAMPAAPPRHPWKLVGPWYRWPRAGLPADGRSAPPALQKFAGAGFIPGFLAEPQHSLVFDAEIDVVSTVDLLPAISGGGLANKLAALFATREDGTPVKPTDATPDILKQLRRARLVPTGLRKLYQPIHDRHYLVVCELHCDLPGFPTVPRGELCQAGFVIRRRQRVVPPALVQEAAERANTLRAAEAGLAELKQATPLRDDLSAKRQAAVQAMADAGTLAPAVAAAEGAIALQRQGLQDWFAGERHHHPYRGLDAAARWHGRPPDPRRLDAAGRRDRRSRAERAGPPAVPAGRRPGQSAARRRRPHHPLRRRPDHQPAARCQRPRPLRRHQHLRDPMLRPPPQAGLPAYRPGARLPRRGGLERADRALSRRRPLRPHRQRQPARQHQDARPAGARGAGAARPRGQQSPVQFIQPQHLSPKIQGRHRLGRGQSGNARSASSPSR